jgi:hypothetical protein
MRWLVAAILSGAVLVSQPALCQNLLGNPGFETDPVSPWVHTGVIGRTNDVFLGTHSGSWACGSYGSNDVLYQDVTTVAGAQYDLSFWVRRNSGGCTWDAYWGGSLIGSSSGPGHDWAQSTYLVSATGTTTRLEFRLNSIIARAGLDDISVVRHGPDPVPEPALIQLPALLGLGGVGYWWRRRRSS